MKKLFTLMLALMLVNAVVSCERNADNLNDISKNSNNEFAKRSDSTGGASTTSSTLPEDVDPKDITPPRR